MEDLMLSLFACLTIPIAMSLFILKGKSKTLIICMLSGIFMCLFAGQINGLVAQTSGLNQMMLTISVTPIVEELVKIIPILLLAFVIKVDKQLLLESALMVGLGFATMENVYILMTNANVISFFWAFSRGLGSAMLHSATSVIVAYGISLCTLRKKTFITGTYAILLSAMVLHGIYNMLVQNSVYMYFGILLPSFVFVILALIAKKNK